MKRISRYFLSVMTLAVVSCGGKQPVAPEEPKLLFPETMVKFVEAGETVTLSFNAFDDWEVSTDKASAAWFWIDDSGIKSYTARGAKGSASIKVVASDEVDFDNERVCTLTIKMAGKTSELAKITKRALARKVTVHKAKVDADGQFIYAEGGGYEYEDYGVSSLSLLWPAGHSGFELPVMITANFDWSIKNTYPAWVDPSLTSGKADEKVALVLRGVNASYPEETSAGTLTFIDVKNQAVASEVSVSIQGYRSIVMVDSNEALSFNVLGQYNADGNWSSEGAVAYLTSSKDAKLLACGGKDWITMTPENWDESDPSKIQTRRVQVAAAENNGQARKASLVAIPPTVDPDAVADLFGNVKEEYAKYVFAVLDQAGYDPESGFKHVSPANSEFLMAVRGASFARAESSEPYEVYQLKYNNYSSYENTNLILSDAVASVKVSSSDIAISYPSAGSQRIFSVVPQTYDEFSADVTCYDSSNSVIAVIKVVVDGSFWPVVKYDDIRFMMKPEHAVLEKLTSGKVYDKYKSYDIPMYKLTYTAEDGARNAMFYVPPFNANSMSSYEYDPAGSWLGSEYGEEQSSKPYLQVRMNSTNPEQGKEGTIVLKAGETPIFVLVCVRDFLK